MALSPTPPDPPSSATAATATPRLFANPPPPQTRPPTPPPLPQSQPHYSNPHPQLYSAQALPNIAPRFPANAIHPQLAPKPHDSPQGILYPVASSGRGFLPKAIRPQSIDQTVTIANPGGFPPRPVVGGGYPHSHHPVRPFGLPHSDPHLMRPTHLQHSLLGSSGGLMVKGVPVSAHQKVAPSQPSVADCNGYKDLRDRSRDDSFVTVKDRKVRICEGSSIYSLCRSWMRNGSTEEIQPQYVDGVKSLPKPLPTPTTDTHSPMKRKGDKEEDEEEEEGSVEHLSPADLLQRHIKRAKKVRARLREERLQRIARYKSRLALLLPPLVEQQQLRNDSATGN